MLFLLSPAKSLDYESASTLATHTLPKFRAQAAELVEILREKTPAQIASLMKLSDSLATLNVARYQAWSSRFTAKNSKQAVLAFNGDVYDGLDAGSLSEDALMWLQAHLVILSGLYGVLSPLDWMQPYRLEMGTKLENAKGKDLYAFWQATIAQELNHRLAGKQNAVVVNLASQEYFKSVDLNALKARVVECVFQEYKSGQYKVISFYAKRARGLMVRYAVQHRVEAPEALKAFDWDGYVHTPAASEPDRLVFRRKQNG